MGDPHYAFPVLLPVMERDLGWSRTTLIGAYIVAVITAGLAALAVGPLLDRHPARPLMTAGSILAVLSVVGWAAASSLGAFYACGSPPASLRPSSCTNPPKSCRSTSRTDEFYRSFARVPDQPELHDPGGPAMNGHVARDRGRYYEGVDPSLLPEQALTMPAELVRIDRLLDDDRFFAPYREFFHATLGRPSIPIETYLRLMFLKYRYRLGFETLCREVTDSITWQRFCRIPLGGRVPHPTTLMKITTRCGEAAVNGLNEALLARAVEARVLKTNRVRADTTVVSANVAYPSDSSLLAKGVAKMVKNAQRLKAMGLATRTRLVDKTRTVRSRARSINANLRRRTDDKIAEVRRINAELADVAERVAGQADAVVRNARRTLRTLGDQASGRARAAVAELERTAALTRRVAAQTRQRLAGATPPGATRWCRCTMPMLVRSPRAGSASRSSSATRHSLSTTKTVSSSITTSKRGTRPTRRCWRRRSSGSSSEPDARRER